MSHVILFDGICSLCEYTVRWVQKLDKSKQFQYVSFQSKEGLVYVKKHGVDLGNIKTVLYITDDEVFDRSDALLAIIRELDSWLRILYFLRHIPNPLRDSLYSLVARYRYLIFGKRQSCFIP